MNELDALREVERLGRMLVDELDGAVLTGECNTDCDNSSECGKISTVEAVCPKCSEKFDVESDCNGIFECNSQCTADVAVDLPDTEVETLRQMRLALVQLDLARQVEIGCTCANIQAKDASRHFLECPLRAKYPKPLSGPLAEQAAGAALGEGAARLIDKSILDELGLEPAPASWPGMTVYQPKAPK